MFADDRDGVAQSPAAELGAESPGICNRFVGITKKFVSDARVLTTDGRDESNGDDGLLDTAVEGVEAGVDDCDPELVLPTPYIDDVFLGNTLLRCWC